MALTYKLGKDLSTPPSGEAKGVQTGVSVTKSDAATTKITIEGPLPMLESIQPTQGAVYSSAFPYIPNDGSYVQSSTITSDGRGGGTLNITCVNPGADTTQSPATPTKITYRLTMAEEQTDLIAHPTITASTTVVDICLKWLATDDAKKHDGTHYQYDEGDGETFTPISDATAIKFCQAWMHGIKTYNRYFPVVEKISTWKRVPGLTLSGAQITGGTITTANFSADIGKWDSPAITLAGYSSTGFFKSKDDWTQNAKSSWTRTEQWVWTPDGSGSNYGWIYQSSNNS